MFRKLRIFILLLVLGAVALMQFGTMWNLTDWNEQLWIGVYPVNADGSQRSSKHIANLSETGFAAIGEFLEAEAARHGRPDAKIRVLLGNEQAEMPPLPPQDRSLFGTIWWSLQLRGWADDRDTLPNGLRPDIRLYLLYYDPATSPALPHSLGLDKGQVGIVHVFAHRQMHGSNQFVITHELLHTLGATDKYDPATSLPRYPEGYAEPDRQPRWPQSAAEIMGGRIPLGPDRAETPESLGQAQVGAETASEIGWRDDP